MHGYSKHFQCWQLHICVLVMSIGPYQKSIILCWFHRGIGFLQMEQPFTRSLRAAGPAVIGSHDIWSVGMTRVWQRRGGTIFIPIVSQANLLISSAVFILGLCSTCWKCLVYIGQAEQPVLVWYQEIKKMGEDKGPRLLKPQDGIHSGLYHLGKFIRKVFPHGKNYPLS